MDPMLAEHLDTFEVDSDTQSAMLAGLEQMRASLFGPRWDLVPYKTLRGLAKHACLSVQGLTPAEVLLLGSYLAASARTQLGGALGG